MIRPILIISLFTVPIIALSCYGYNDYQEIVETLHHRTACTAVYEVSDGTGAFGGIQRHPSRIRNIANSTTSDDCIRQTVNDNLGLPSSEMYFCYCYTEMCNYPFTWEEFQRRGFTLKPQYVSGSKE
ncbi:hypothetical protein L5515_019585 [Caenorhabditis briggsae]|nr:hypothetical protein L5515_019585 [Caenorhabditis briggsae]